MKIGDLERAKDVFTGKTSDGVRQFAFAGIAVVWLLRIDGAPQPIPHALTPALTMLCLALVCDLLQYIASSVMWGVYYKWKLREKLAEDTDFEEPWFMTFPGYFFFLGKIGFVLVGWWWLAAHLIKQWRLA